MHPLAGSVSFLAHFHFCRMPTGGWRLRLRLRAVLVRLRLVLRFRRGCPIALLVTDFRLSTFCCRADVLACGR